MNTIICFASPPSYRNLKLALLVGGRGGVPVVSGQDTALRDVVISKPIIQYDYGRQYPGRFVVRNALEDCLGKAGRGIRSLLSHFETEHGREQLQSSSVVSLSKLQETAIRRRRRANYRRPDRSEDCLFPPDYGHKHHGGCEVCSDEAEFPCENAVAASCRDLGCEPKVRVPRENTADDAAYAPEIFIGRIGSGSVVMRSGIDRDRTSEEHGIIAFEIESAGVWDEVPCLVVKGISDYADSHKNKTWQDFAAATAASVARAIIDRYVVDDEARNPSLADAQQSSSNTGGAAGPGTKRETRSISNNSFGDGAWINQGDIHQLEWIR